MHGGRNDWTALHWAAAEGRQVLCARLLRENADPTQVPRAALGCHSGLSVASFIFFLAVASFGIMPVVTPAVCHIIRRFAAQLPVPSEME